MRKKAKNICAWMLVAAVFILSGNTVYADTEYMEEMHIGGLGPGSDTTTFYFPSIIYYAPYADGIDYTAVFDVEYYYANNPDLQQTIGKNDALLFQDFLDNGMALGRQGSAYFDVNVYRKENPDLAALYGDDLKQYYLHYIMAGWQERRTACIMTDDMVTDIMFYYTKVKQAAENEVRNFIEKGSFNVSMYNIGWECGNVYYYENYTHYEEVCKYAEKAAYMVCKENPQFDWCETMVVSNISWSKNPYSGPEIYDRSERPEHDWRYRGESFNSGGYITLNCDHEHGEKHY
ncbi:MAG: hypothetical protein HDR25_03335 [Lachnospiraceae bacterium]|nr:hypothetical protein [Lachnospiraceae bacterium]